MILGVFLGYLILNWVSDLKRLRSSKSIKNDGAKLLTHW